MRTLKLTDDEIKQVHGGDGAMIQVQAAIDALRDAQTFLTDAANQAHQNALEFMRNMKC